VETLDRAVVTGATGFVGRTLAARLGGSCSALRFGDDGWRERLARAELRGASVFHLAARVHRPGDRDTAAYERDNVAKTLALAEAAAAAGARRVVFLSTVKVNGEESGVRPFRPGDLPAPLGAYARSKWAAERALARVAGEAGLAVVVVRAPLVFGAGAAGNLRALLRLADTPWPLPFASLHNRRSFVHVDDLVRLLVACALAPAAPGGTFFAAHREPFSTAQLVALLRHALGRPRHLFAFPASALEAAAVLLGQRDAARPLTRSLEVDTSATEGTLGWKAEVPIESAALEIGMAYRSGGGA
jgi:nucleoside-diphosphate-sugar epimerase